MTDTLLEKGSVLTITEGVLAGCEVTVEQVEGDQVITNPHLIQNGVSFVFSKDVLERIAQSMAAVA